MGSYTYASTLGIVIPDTSETQAVVEQEWKDALGQDMPVTPETPQGVLITGEVSARDSVARNNAFMANQMNPNYASGRWLDALCSWLGLTRDPAQRTLVPGVLCGGSPGTIIPKGSRAVTVFGDVFRSLQTVQIPTPEGWAIVDFESVDAGPIPCGVGNFERPDDLVLGWETVNNTAAGITGTLEQSDTSLRAERNDTLALQGISTPEAQLSAVRALPGVTGAVFRENYTNTDATIDGVFLLAKSVWLCVDGGETEAIGKALLENKTAGANWNGDILAPTVDTTSGQTYLVKFDRADRIDVYVRVTLRPGTDTSDPTVSIPMSVANWSNGEVPGEIGLRVGTPVSPFEISNGIGYYHPGFQIVKVEIGTTPGEFSTLELSMTLKQRALIERSYVSVVVV